MRLALIVLASAVSGCASSSGVFEISPGIYSVSSTAITSFGGAATARGDALKKATQTCASQGKQMELVNQQSSANIASGSTDVTFRCVSRTSGS
jgi:hypothetical protein